MAKVTGGLLSLDAAGSIAGTVTFAKWRGVAYARQRVVPANPKSTAQVLTRDIFRNLETRWKQGGPLVRATWDRFAVGQKFVGRNAYMGQNIAILRGDADMAQYIASPGAKGGLPPTTLVATPGVAQISCAVTEPATPTGWTLTSAICTCLKDQTPEASVADIIVAGEDVTTPFVIVLTGLDTVLYQVQAWLKWAKPDGSIAYGASITDSATPT